MGTFVCVCVCDEWAGYIPLCVCVTSGLGMFLCVHVCDQWAGYVPVCA